MLLLVLLASLHHGWTADIPRETKYVMRHNVSCPASGYFLDREMRVTSMDPDICHLCFCQTNDTAVCWSRGNRSCDLEHYRDFGKRMRRSALSFDEVFVRDATRKFFNKQSPEKCKPFESSFSDGCPPVDWCIGCTVCDCNANGRWDCHILSFCTEKNGEQQMKKRRRHPKNPMTKRQSKTSTTNIARSTKNTTNPPNKTTRKRPVKLAIKRNQAKRSQPSTRHRIEPIKGTKVNKFGSVKKPLPNAQAKKAIPSRNKVTNKPPLIKKKTSTNNMLNIKSSRDKNMKNNTLEAQKVVNPFMKTMQKVIKNIDRQANNTSKQVNKVIKKRSMQRQETKKGLKGENKRKFLAKPTPKLNFNVKAFSKKSTAKPQISRPYNNGRIKKQIGVSKKLLHLDDSNNSSKDSVNRQIKETMGKNQIQKFPHNLTIAELNTTNTFNNTGLNFTHLKSNMNKEIYITENHIYTENHDSTLGNGQLYSKVNNFETTTTTILRTINDNESLQNTSNYNLEEMLSFTERVYVPTGFVQFSMNTTNETEKVHDDYKRNNITFKLKMKLSNSSTEIEHHNCKFKALLHKLISSKVDRYNQTVRSLETSRKPKKYTILNNIKRLFKKIFRKNNKRKFYYKDSLYYGDCDKKDYKISGHCNLYVKEKKKISQRLNELKTESDNILNTVRIFKRLLHRLETNTNETEMKMFWKPNTLIERINQPNAIVKTTYSKEDSGRKLTENQRTQINDIRKNVEVFIKSIGKFANILEDIIKFAMSHIEKQKILNNNETTNTKNYTKHKLLRYDATKNKVEKLKSLILNYKLLQLKFINDIFIILNNLEIKVSDKNNLQFMHQGSFMNINKTNDIDTNSMNIIKNIRKLRLLAEKNNKATAQRRQKRETVDDEDALEYLLILMEYLLRRHNPTNPPVSDGIDLLIEAIKSAPDIKLIRKKVIDNITQKPFVTRTATPMNSFNEAISYSTSYKGRTDKKKILARKHNKTKIEDQSEDDSDDDENKIQEIYRTFKSDKDSVSGQNQEDTLLVSDANEKTINFDNNLKESTTRRSNNQPNKVLTSTKTVDLKMTSVSPVTVGNNVMIADLKDSLKSKINTDNFLVDAKANIDWIEENFKENKQPHIEKEMLSTPKRLFATRTHKKAKDVSEVSKENEVYNDKKGDKTSVEKVISKKQMDLLSSLDYVGEKEIEDDIDSKDDKYLNDIYV